MYDRVGSSQQSPEKGRKKTRFGDRVFEQDKRHNETDTYPRKWLCNHCGRSCGLFQPLKKQNSQG
jgi:hypothetical protein